MALVRLYPRMASAVVACVAVALGGCEARTAITNSPQNDRQLKRVQVRSGRLHRVLRSNGSVQAINALTMRVPQIEGQSGNLTITKLITAGAEVKEGDLLAEFDRTKQL